MRWLRHPAAPSMVLFAAITLAGFAAMALGWRVAARTLFVPFQVPALVSGGMGGLALVVLGIGFAAIQAERRAAAVERAETDALLDELAALVAAARHRRATTPPVRRRRRSA